MSRKSLNEGGELVPLKVVEKEIMSDEMMKGENFRKMANVDEKTQIL